MFFLKKKTLFRISSSDLTECTFPFVIYKVSGSFTKIVKLQFVKKSHSPILSLIFDDGYSISEVVISQEPLIWSLFQNHFKIPEEVLNINEDSEELAEFLDQNQKFLHKPFTLFIKKSSKLKVVHWRELNVKNEIALLSK